jgi:predicted O-methyltransferase YrrM
MSSLNADSILALARGFIESRILLSAAELDLFTLLTPTPLSAEEITARLAADLRALTILLDALAGMGLLSKREGKYRCEPEIATFLSADSPQSVLPMVLHSAAMWSRWSELTGIARGDSTALARAQKPPGPQSQRAFIGGMHVVASPLAPAIVAAIDPGPARALLDVGGASGTYTIAFLRASPQLRATLFDLPPVIDLARERLSQAGLLDRVRLVGGDFYLDELPGGHDLALLSAIIHQNSREQNVELYRKVWRALLPGGRIVIRDHVVSPDRTEPREAAVFAVNMLVRTAGGNVYTFEETSADLTQAGFERVQLIQRGVRMVGLVEAFKPVT